MRETVDAHWRGRVAELEEKVDVLQARLYAATAVMQRIDRGTCDCRACPECWCREWLAEAEFE